LPQDVLTEEVFKKIQNGTFSYMDIPSLFARSLFFLEPRKILLNQGFRPGLGLKKKIKTLELKKFGVYLFNKQKLVET